MRWAIVGTCAALLSSLGCAATAISDGALLARAGAHERGRCERDASVLRSPQRLVARGAAALAQRDLDRSYCYFALVRTLHPQAAEASGAFANAAVLFKTLYLRERYANPGAIWFTSEPEFLFAWLASFYDEGFPQAEVEALLRSMPAPFAAELDAWAAAHPRMARWRVEVTDDNGLIETVQAAPR